MCHTRFVGWAGMGERVQTFRFAAKCSPSQHRRLVVVSGMCAELYNACLESWKGTYAWWREHNPGVDAKFPAERRQSYYDRRTMFKGVRADRPEWAGVAFRVGAGVLTRFGRTEQGFYDRCAKGRRPGFPRFKKAARWRTIEIVDAYESMLVAPNSRGNGSAVWWRLRVKGIPRLRFQDKGRLTTALADGATVREIRVVRTVLRVEVHVIVKHPATTPPSEPTNPVGVDAGLKTRVALSDGTCVPARQPDYTDIKRRQRALSRAKKGSNTRKKKRRAYARAWARETERTRQADWRLAHRIITRCDGIAVEDLNVAGMLRTKMFSKKISEQRWAALSAMLEHKAAKAGIRYVRVNPANTSTDCSACGHRQPMPLSVRVFNCGNCGMSMDRDCNSAKNTCARAYGPGSGGATPDAMRNKLLSEDATHPRGEPAQTDIAEQYTRTPPGHPGI